MNDKKILLPLIMKMFSRTFRILFEQLVWLLVFQFDPVTVWSRFHGLSCTIPKGTSFRILKGQKV